jgi:16S rRNA (cytidine1402-2'-O)-methyltransferase
MLPSPITDQPTDSISTEVIRVIHSLQHFIVERARTSRRFVSSTAHPVKTELLHFFEMPEGEISPEEMDILIQPLLDGIDMGIMSEAGLPAVADPGNKVVAAAHKNNIRVIPLAGPSSIMMALMASGLEGQRFSFHGYLSAKRNELASQLKELEKKADRDDATQLFIEAPYRNHQVMSETEKVLDSRRMFSIAAGLGNSESFIETRTIAEWKKKGWPNIHKIPAVFLLR